MEISYAELSSPGTVRTTNEDAIGFWQPATLEEKRARGAIAVLADGVGGQDRGDVASRLAVDAAIDAFRQAKENSSPAQLIAQAANAANRAVYDERMDHHGQSRMATTLAVAILRNDHVTVGNVGDSRVYHVHKDQIRQLTTDHSYVGLQRKLGLISEEEARRSEHRSILTRTIGQEPIAHLDSDEVRVNKGDFIILCCDGLYTCVTDAEINDIVGRFNPEPASRQLIALAEQRGTQDNVSVQIIRIDEIEEVGYYRGVPSYHKPFEPAPTGEFQPGQLLDDRFFIQEMVSRSGMATIYRATDRQTKQTVAVKVPLMQYESDPAFYSRFQREEKIGRQLDHPAILKFIPVENRSRPYIVTEYLRGYTLAYLLNNVRPLPEKDALQIASRLCDALEHMHGKGIIHRDLKPQNIMLCYDGSLRIMDFGIAKAIEGRRLTFTGFTPAMGTPDYMAPEQIKGKRGDARTDIYSLGAILYEMLTGHAPFEGENPFVIMNARLTGDPIAPRKANPKLSPPAEEIVLHAMERNPDRRYPSAAAMKAELDAVDKVQLTGRADRLQPPATGRALHPQLRWLLLALAVPLLTALVLALIFLLRHPAPTR